MTRRQPEDYRWNFLLFDETILRKHFTEREPGRMIDFIVIHHMAMVGQGDGKANDVVYRAWQTRPASAHYGIDGEYVRQFVWDKDIAWACGNWRANERSISIEHANETGKPRWTVSDETWHHGARLVAHLCKVYKLGRPTANRTVKRHRDTCNGCTECPGPYLGDKIFSQYVARAAAVYDRL